MNRRAFLRSCIAIAAGAGISQASSDARKFPKAGKRKRPNVIFILADDLGYGELGCYGQEKIRTPNIDRLAAEGMKFSQHYSGQAVCAPSRCSLLTGKHMGHAYIRSNKSVEGGYQMAVPESTVTVGHIFQKEGYKTGCVGKWGLGGPGTSGQPDKQGFDFYYGNLSQGYAHWYYPPFLWKNNEKVYFEGNENVKGTHYSHDYMAEEALNFIKENKDEAFFLYVPFIIPHVSLQVPQDSLDEYLKEGWSETPYPGAHYTAHETPRACYAAMITRMDGDIGRIMDMVKSLGLDDDTIIMFSSDNGPTYCCGVDYEFFESAGPLKGLKGSLNEGGIRVPLIARWPGRIEAGATSDHISAFCDFMPTCCDILGVQGPGDIDGISYLPELLGKKQKEHDYLYWEFPAYGYQQTVRMGRWKGYRKNVKKNPNPKLELYDLETDIGQKNDVAEQWPDVVRKIEKIMEDEHVPSSLWPLLCGEK
jgi:arylsulfatase